MRGNIERRDEENWSIRIVGTIIVIMGIPVLLLQFILLLIFSFSKLFTLSHITVPSRILSSDFSPPPPSIFRVVYHKGTTFPIGATPPSTTYDPDQDPTQNDVTPPSRPDATPPSQSPAAPTVTVAPPPSPTDATPSSQSGAGATPTAPVAKFPSSPTPIIKTGVLASIVVSVVSVGGPVFLLIAGICFFRRKHKYQPAKEEDGVDEYTKAELEQYGFATIQTATANFSVDNKLGEGGFGVVYKGIIASTGQEIAVKRLSSNSKQGTQEFKNELLLVAKLQHRNLVKLLGFCLEKGEKMLIYEYIPKRSLDYYLFDPIQREKLNWTTRFQIIKGIARGLLYLHEDSQLRVIHRDLKASNVLLDADMNTKISDFGMARICVADQNQGNTKRIVGTYGYMSPEYAMHGHFSVKSDAFSFGVLILEIISGKKVSLSLYESGFLSHAWNLWNKGIPLEFIDNALVESYSRKEIIRCMHIGLLCVQEDPRARPLMIDVVFMLNHIDSVIPPPPRQAVSISCYTSEHKPIISDSKLVSSNQITISELYPR